MRIVRPIRLPVIEILYFPEPAAGQTPTPLTEDEKDLPVLEIDVSVSSALLKLFFNLGHLRIRHPYHQRLFPDA